MNGLAAHVNAELALAVAAPDSATAFQHLERAHILSQYSTRDHVRVHWAMLRWALTQSAPGELLGQMFRLVGAATKTPFGMIPTGNTGGANVSPFRPMPIPDDLAEIIDAHRG